VSRPHAPKRLKSIAAAAEYADLSQRTIRRYVAAGTITGYRVGPRLIKIDLNELDRLARPVAAARP
jgi:excisionase family DNA binding protein